MLSKTSSLVAALAILSGIFAPQARASADCVRIYYDADDTGPKAKDSSGRLTALYLQNLLGHFPRYQQIVEPISHYLSGQVRECKATFYLGWNPDGQVPSAFLDDFVSGAGRVAWVGSTIGKLGDARLANVFGHRLESVAGLDKKNREPGTGHPTFYKNILYKGEVFWKYGQKDQEGGFSGDFNMAVLVPIASRADVTALAQVEHNGTARRIPYILQRTGASPRFFVADNPFSYVHEADRYLVFSDLIFDVLDEQALHGGKHYAVLRVEDVHGCMSSEGLLKIGQVASERGIPFSIALIPIFSDPFHKYDRCREIKKARIAIGERPEFLATMRTLQAQGAKVVWHGVTHQADGEKNPESGVSGDDYEFWDYKKKRAMAWDSPQAILDRMSLGWQAMTDAGLSSQIWEVPHYMASMLDYRVFSRLFSWQIGRITYYPNSVSNLPPESPALWFEQAGLSANATNARRQALGNISVRVSPGVPETTLFPYEIYGDYYGQRVLPESMGYVTHLSTGPDSAKHSKTHEESRSIDDLIAAAKRNRVIRDGWASFFFHPYLLEDGGDPEQLRRLVREIQSMGYEFVDLERFINQSGRKTLMRPEPVER